MYVYTRTLVACNDIYYVNASTKILLYGILYRKNLSVRFIRHLFFFRSTVRLLIEKKKITKLLNNNMAPDGNPSGSGVHFAPVRVVSLAVDTIFSNFYITP